jgi:hypothetical protein
VIDLDVYRGKSERLLSEVEDLLEWTRILAGVAATSTRQRDELLETMRLAVVRLQDGDPTTCLAVLMEALIHYV